MITYPDGLLDAKDRRRLRVACRDQFWWVHYPLFLAAWLTRCPCRQLHRLPMAVAITCSSLIRFVHSSPSVSQWRVGLAGSGHRRNRVGAVIFTSVLECESYTAPDDTSAELSHDGYAFNSIIHYKGDDQAARNKRPLVSISVRDVDNAYSRVRPNGREILEPATDPRDRDGFAVVSDARDRLLSSRRCEAPR